MQFADNPYKLHYVGLFGCNLSGTCRVLDGCLLGTCPVYEIRRHPPFFSGVDMQNGG